MVNHTMDAEEDALLRTYPYALYFVQSPSTISHSNSADLRPAINESAFHSPLRSESFPTNPTTNAATHEEEGVITRFALSRYSSSRGSNNSFLHEKKIAYDLQSHGTDENGENRLIIVHGGVEKDGDDGEEEEEEEEEGDCFGGRKGWWWRYFSFRTSSSLVWISLQIIWRLLASLGVALLVFYIATKPPPPTVSLKIARIQQFELGEGVDASGVTTKMLTFNCSIDLLIENKSKLFTLHIHPPLMQMSFANLPLAISYGPQELNAGSDGTTLFQLHVSTVNKPVYGGGRAMQDLLDTGKGLPLAIRLSFGSSFRVVGGLFRPKFHHKADCSLVLHRSYDKKHRTQAFNSSCIIKR